MELELIMLFIRLVLLHLENHGLRLQMVMLQIWQFGNHNQIGVNVKYVILDMPVRNAIPVPLVIVDVMTSAAQKRMLAIAQVVMSQVGLIGNVLVEDYPCALVDLKKNFMLTRQKPLANSRNVFSIFHLLSSLFPNLCYFLP